MAKITIILANPYNTAPRTIRRLPSPQVPNLARRKIRAAHN